MRYRNDYTNTIPADYTQQSLSRPCGAFNSGLYGMGAQPLSGSLGAVPGFNGAVMGTHQMNGGVTPSQLALPALPTGFPTGGTPTPLIPTSAGVPAGVPSTVPSPAAQGSVQVPATVESTLFTPGFLRTQIGRRVRVEFLIGTNNLTDRTGTLVGVGASYILLTPIDSDDLMMCDIYSIKFVTIIL